MNLMNICKVCGKQISEYEHDWKDGLCFGCYERQQEMKLASKLQNNIVTETNCEQDIVCPYCGYRMEDDDSYFIREQEGEYECPECEKTFYFQACIDITYSTQRKENQK